LYHRNKDKKTKIAFGCKSVVELANLIKSKFQSSGPLSDLEVNNKGFIGFVISEQYYLNIVNKLVVHGCNYKVDQK